MGKVIDFATYRAKRIPKPLTKSQRYLNWHIGVLSALKRFWELPTTETERAVFMHFKLPKYPFGGSKDRCTCCGMKRV